MDPAAKAVRWFNNPHAEPGTDNEECGRSAPDGVKRDMPAAEDESDDGKMGRSGG